MRCHSDSRGGWNEGVVVMMGEVEDGEWKMEVAALGREWREERGKEDGSLEREAGADGEMGRAECRHQR